QHERVTEGAVPAGLLAQRRQRQQQAAAALARPTPARVLRAERDEAETVAAAGGGMADRKRDALGDVRLAPVGGAEVHRRRRVEYEPGDEHTLRELDAHVRRPRAGGDVPVDPAHVVARLVRPHLVELRTEAGEGRAVVAREEPVDAARDRELERLEALGADRARPGPRRRPLAAGCGDQALQLRLTPPWARSGRA